MCRRTVGQTLKPHYCIKTSTKKHGYSIISNNLNMYLIVLRQMGGWTTGQTSKWHNVTINQFF